MTGILNQNRQSEIGRVDTSPVLPQPTDSLNSAYQSIIASTEAGNSRSDPCFFCTLDVPGLFFSISKHTGYHAHGDNIEKLNDVSMPEVFYSISDISFHISAHPDNFQFAEACPKESSGSRGRDGLVTFGLKPEVKYNGHNGMPVSLITYGKPAAIDSMISVDTIIRIDGSPVGNLYDSME